MKKLLYGTTALVGATALIAASAQAADPIQIKTIGWINNLYGVVSVDEAAATDDFNSVATHLDAQVNFTGSTTLDNGIEVGVRLEIEMPNPGSLDETFVYLKGDFGEVRAGNHNSAGYAMLSGVPGVGAAINSGWISGFIPAVAGYNTDFRNTAISTGIDFTNDDNTIVYFTPRFSGFQLGASFTPNAPKSNTNTGNTETNAGGAHNGVSIAATFVESFNGVNIDIGASYANAQADDQAGSEDIEQVMVSANIGVAGFTIGGQFASQLEGTDNASDPADGVILSEEGESWGVGATYATGPWAVGLSYMHGEMEDVIATPGDDELDAAAFGVSYTLGPGVRTDFTAMYADWQDEGGASQDGFAGIVGIYVSF